MPDDEHEVTAFTLATDRFRLPGNAADFTVGRDGPSAVLTQGVVIAEWYSGVRCAYPVGQLGYIQLAATGKSPGAV